MTRPKRTGTGHRGAAAAALAVMLSVHSASPAAASILERVLGRIAGLGISPLAAVMVNAAINDPVPALAPRGLEAGQRVIIGYDPQGQAVTETAGPEGLWVSPQMAEGLQSGLAAGLYPEGSALYRLPPAGQLSLYEADRDGNRLDLAVAASLAVVDGSITNIIDGLLLPDLAPVQVLSADLGSVPVRAIDMDRINSTVLGAVNSGEILAVTESVMGADAEVRSELERARIATGGTIALAGAVTSDAMAQALASREIGGGPDARAITANLSVNMAGVQGRVTTIVTGQSTTIRSITATVIGAVNSGIVAQDRMAGDGIER